jgi:N-acetylglutamate synthase-like GNAT family acetyltransferase
MVNKMILVKTIDDSMFEKINEFLKTVESISDIEEDVVKNAVYSSNGDDILGMISYEKFNEFGLIRYFVFKKSLEILTIKNMLNLLKENARNNGLKYLFSIINDDKIIDLFKELEFENIDKNYFFIEEKNINNTKYKDSTILLKKLSN